MRQRKALSSLPLSFRCFLSLHSANFRLCKPLENKLDKSLLDSTLPRKTLTAVSAPHILVEHFSITFPLCLGKTTTRNQNIATPGRFQSMKNLYVPQEFLHLDPRFSFAVLLFSWERIHSTNNYRRISLVKDLKMEMNEVTSIYKPYFLFVCEQDADDVSACFQTEA